MAGAWPLGRRGTGHVPHSHLGSALTAPAAGQRGARGQAAEVHALLEGGHEGEAAGSQTGAEASSHAMCGPTGHSSPLYRRTVAFGQHPGTGSTAYRPPAP